MSQVEPSTDVPPATSIVTDRLSLDPLTVDDAVEMVDVLAAPSLYDFIGGEPPMLPELTERYRRQVAGSPRAGETWRNWVVRAYESVVGFVQATIRDDGERRVADVAWLIAPEYQGRGIATEAAAAMVAHLRRAYAVATIEARIADANAGSTAVARRIGLAPSDRVDDGERLWTDVTAG